MTMRIFVSRDAAASQMANLHDLPRTALVAPLLDQVNCMGKPIDEGRVDHCGFPCLATASCWTSVRISAYPALAGNIVRSALP